MSLKKVYSQLQIIKDHPGRLDKEELIKGFVNDYDFKKVILYALDPFKQYKTNRISFINNIDNYKTKCQKLGTIEGIFMMLDYLASKSGANNQDIEYLSIYSSIDKETVDVIYKIINKDLDCGAGLVTFKKYIPELVDYNCMLCKDDLEKYLKICDLNTSWWSEKLDGVRCTTKTNNKFGSNNTIYLSRNGKEFPNFSIYDNAINHFYEIYNKLYPELDNYPLDGESIAVTTNNKDKKTFQKLMTQIRRLKDIDPNLFQFNVFDIIIPNKTLSERYNILLDVFSNMNLKKYKNIKLLKHYTCNDFKTIEDVINFVEDKVNNNGWEGIVLKDPRSFYEEKRSKYWCKVKKFITEEFEVIDFEYGNKRNSDVVGKLICLTKDGKKFGCGSGLTDQERIDFLADLPELIEVKFQDYTDDGKPRFPTYVRPRTDKN